MKNQSAFKENFERLRKISPRDWFSGILLISLVIGAVIVDRCTSDRLLQPMSDRPEITTPAPRLPVLPGR